ncbi:hypothetical protein [Peribacillus simplex]|uniref:hypothetical protein n=1 Tax=Peribacillus simplex TaxID=1478 RepID=UPI003D2D4D7D
MKYKIRVYDLHTNKETIKVDEVFETKDVTEAAIEKLKLQYQEKYEYVKVPVKILLFQSYSLHGLLR